MVFSFLHERVKLKMWCGLAGNLSTSLRINMFSNHEGQFQTISSIQTYLGTWYIIPNPGFAKQMLVSMGAHGRTLLNKKILKNKNKNKILVGPWEAVHSQG